MILIYIAHEYNDHHSAENFTMTAISEGKTNGGTGNSAVPDEKTDADRDEKGAEPDGEQGTFEALLFFLCVHCTQL